MNWNSANEILPAGNGEIYEGSLEESKLMLVYGTDPYGLHSYGLGVYIRNYEDPQENGWNGYLDQDWDLDHCKVTHWMPLPEPPKEG